MTVTSPRPDAPLPPGDNRLPGLPQLLGLALAIGLLHAVAKHDYVLFHTVIEMLRVIVLGAVFVLAWHTRRWSASNFLRIIGISSLTVAALELLHALTYKGLGIFPGQNANLPTQLWIAFRYVESASFLFAALTLRIRMRPGILAGAYASVGTLLAGAVFAGYFPDCFVENQGLTPFKVVSEYVIVGIFVAAAAVLYRERARFDDVVVRLLMLSLLFGALSELAFTRYVSVFGAANEIGHYLLGISTWFLYRAVLVTGLIKPFNLLFRELRQHQRNLESEVAERTARLRASQALNTAFIENSPSITLLKDLEGRYTLVNRAFERFFGQSRDAVLGKTVFDLLSEDAARALDHNDRQVRASGAPLVMVEPIRGVAAERSFETVRFPVFDDEGKVAGTGAIFTDITELRLAEARYGLMIRTSMDALVVIASDGRFLEVNDATCELSGYPRERLLAMRILDVEAEFDETRLQAFMQDIAAAGSARFDSRWRRADGSLRDIEVSVNYVNHTMQPCCFCFVRDITERKASMARIEHLAHYDQLTGLPNKLLFEQHVRSALQRAALHGRACALVYLDLDNFKVINDTLGHVVGDALLRQIGARVRQLAADERGCCRFGGDEFLILVEGGDDDAVPAALARQLLVEFARPVAVEAHELVSTVSIGISVFPRDGRDFDTLFKNADTATYVAKAAGRNTYRFFDASMQADALERMRLLGKLHNAIERKELRLHYQPQLDLRSGAVIGAEALIRWQQPELGLVSPARFIPLAEDSGLIVPIGAWVLREACRQAAAWQEAGLPPIVVAVNLSVVQFRHGDLVRTVADALAESGLDPALLELELTESILIGDVDAVSQAVTRLKALGLRLSIDDFGTGYSNLAYLKRFAFDKLKIDQSFVRDMDSNADSCALVRAIVQMAHGLGLGTIAEGVERGELVEQLRRLNCDEAQGYHFGRPMPPEEFADYLARARSRAAA
ncbi:EAL domain-containing protein [Aromatoleum toluvorans]|uniref:EAL domain-containing protein n=1 Tax=Aromatoleum toluvorans TaxID=92002 RepID=A0ABX1PV97_9RHOO|nr:EAL domain-containing protein [Aromatoleum toluvorans]NMG42622.1 EAL domain-containing protein [Aromatoleum toluvorans]